MPMQVSDIDFKQICSCRTELEKFLIKLRNDNDEAIVYFKGGRAFETNPEKKAKLDELIKIYQAKFDEINDVRTKIRIRCEKKAW